MKIRSATLDDYEHLADIFYDSDLYHYQHDKLNNKKPDRHARSKETVSNWINSKDTIMYVAVEEGIPVGLIIVVERTQENTNIFVQKNYAYILDVGVRKEYWAKGIGNVLMKEALHWAEKRNIKSIGLRVDVFNQPAIALYEKYGFKTTSFNMERFD